MLAVRALDALLDYQDYPIPAAKRGAMGRRTLGIGVINFAYWLAKNGKRYSDGSANNLTHQDVRSHSVLPAESLERAGERARRVPVVQRNHLFERHPADRYLQERPGCDLNEPLHLRLGSPA
jgi:ribonucleoside-diphosphate reductase alpha chain